MDGQRTPRMLQALTASLVLAGFFAAANDGEFTSEAYGFRVERPDDSWEFRQETLEASELKLSLYPTDRTLGEVVLTIRAKIVGGTETAEKLLATALRSVRSGAAMAGAPWALSCFMRW